MSLDLLAANDDGAVLAASIIVSVYLAMIAFMVFVYAKIIGRSGYPWPWVFIMFVPIVNLVMLCIFAFKPWPIQRELELTRQALQAATGSPFPPGSQLPGYGSYQIGSGAAGFGPGYGGHQGVGSPVGYGSPEGYAAPSYGSVEGYDASQGDAAPTDNPYSPKY